VIRLTWLQFRTQAFAAFGALAVVAITLAVTDPNLTHLYDASGIVTCGTQGDCPGVATAFLNKIPADQILYFLGIVVLFAVPAIIGMFWGAPLISRELETGTYRLAWTQGVTRTRWLAVKLSVTGLVAMTAAGLLSLMLTWWSSPIDTATTLKTGNSISFIRIGPILFVTRGIVPVGYAAFAFVLGVAAGTLIRRTIPAIAITLAGVALATVAMPLWVRPHLIAPDHAIVTLTSANISPSLAQGPGTSDIVMPLASSTQPGSWILATQTLDKAGHPFNAAAVPACQGSNSQVCQAALGKLGLRDLITYQAPSRFWPLQWDETGILFGATLMIAAACFWRLRRQIS
jgi:hypothetical protein